MAELEVFLLHVVIIFDLEIVESRCSWFRDRTSAIECYW